MQSNLVALTICDDLKIEGPESLGTLSVGYASAMVMIHKFIPNFRAKVPVSNSTLLPKMLMANRFDVAIVLKSLVEDWARRFDLKGHRVLDPPLQVLSFYIVLPRRHADFAKTLADTLRAMKANGTCDALCPPCFH